MVPKGNVIGGRLKESGRQDPRSMRTMVPKSNVVGKIQGELWSLGDNGIMEPVDPGDSGINEMRHQNGKHEK